MKIFPQEIFWLASMPVVVNAMRKTPHICDICNGRYTYAHRARHFKSQKHQTTVNNNV